MERRQGPTLDAFGAKAMSIPFRNEVWVSGLAVDRKKWPGC